MVRRWFLRSIGLMLVAACIVAWTGSYWKWVVIMRIGQTHDVYFHLSAGWVKYAIAENNGLGSRGWQYFIDGADPFSDRMGYLTTPYHFAGFAWFPNGGSEWGWGVYVPIWFLTLLSTGLLCLVWRRTRLKQAGRAFPVESTTARNSAAG